MIDLEHFLMRLLHITNTFLCFQPLPMIFDQLDHNQINPNHQGEGLRKWTDFDSF